MSGGAALHEAAPAKVNLCLFLGPVRPADGRHELVTAFQPLTLADRVTLEPAPPARRDEVVCPGLDLRRPTTSRCGRCRPSARAPAGTRRRSA